MSMQTTRRARAAHGLHNKQLNSEFDASDRATRPRRVRLLLLFEADVSVMWSRHQCCDHVSSVQRPASAPINNAYVVT
jgi:hypothetical protein